MRFLFLLIAVAVAASAESNAIVVNAATAKWEHDAHDPPGSQSVVLREDPQTGAFEMLVRYPAGHVFAPHWHSANERIVLLEGKLSIQVGQVKTELEPAGLAFLPAKEVQRLACVSKTPCGFYVYWDGKLDSHKAP